MEDKGITYHRLKISEIKELAEDFKLFYFEDVIGLNYLAGQYLTLASFTNGNETRRSYSLTSSPDISERLCIGVKRVPNGFFSRLLVDLAKPGDILLSTGAGGLFTLPGNNQDFLKVFFFAAGAGITPCMSLIKTILFAHQHISIQLVYSNASEGRAFFREELQELQQRFPLRLKIDFLYSNSRDLSRARLHPDLLREFLRDSSSIAPAQTLYFICGPVDYMDMCTFTIQALGVPKQNLRKENFILEGPVVLTALPPDRSSRMVEISYAGTTHVIKVDYPQSILQASKKAGLRLPYSCESGRCGNCVAHCTSGKVWHSYNEVLTDGELERGLVLTCVGHPEFSDLKLSII